VKKDQSGGFTTDRQCSKWKLNYINNFKSDLLLTFGFIELHYKFNRQPEPVTFPKNPTNKPITQNARKSNSSTTKKTQHSSHAAPTEQDNYVSNVIRVFWIKKMKKKKKQKNLWAEKLVD
jgi:hypothetical protein